MPINHELKIIHIHIPKTGGTSVNESIFNNNTLNMNFPSKKTFYGNYIKEDGCMYEMDHSTINFLKKNAIGYNNNYFKFCYIRNPYSRLVSEYLHCKKHGSRFINDTSSFENYVMELKKKFSIVIDNIEKKHHLVSHYIPQYYFIYNKDKILCVDYVARFEKINAYWKQIIKRAKINNKLKKSNKRCSGNYDWKDYYKNNNIKDIVYNLYIIDFETFNYPKDFISN
jgi:hypothetical protein